MSLGYMTTFNDIMTFVDFVKEYIDKWPVCWFSYYESSCWCINHESSCCRFRRTLFWKQVYQTNRPFRANTYKSDGVFTNLR